MKTIPRLLVTFESDAFNASESKDYFINECCFGDDVARWLIAKLRARGVQTGDQPGQEDFGWYLTFVSGGRAHRFVIGCRPGDEAGPDLWIGWLERDKGTFGRLFGGHNRGIGPSATNAIHQILKASAEVRNVRWHRRHEFDANREELGTDDPESR
ncbi:MAG: hypothetical protein ACR2OZ_17935 [Verrucomicrobiales bacterium]